MNRPEKWLPGVTAASKVRAVARQTLALRLERAAKFLKRSTKNSEEQAEHIHKLRTWCRRSAAAVELWRPLLPKQEAKWFAGKLKKIRQAAGDVRDLDVMLEQTGDNHSLARELNKQRNKALQPIARLHKRLVKRDKLDKRQRRLLRDIKEPKVRLGEWAKRRAGKQAAALLVLGQRSLQPLEAAHEFRIACKELRYVLEIVGGALPPAAAKLYERLGDLQQRIGVVCDQAAAEKMYAALLAKVSRSHRQPFRDAASTARQEKSRRHRALLRWWTAQRRKAFHQALANAGLLEK
ncbi:MAG TPA: CHAD domain-containing protein [Pirellulaceae bacterium]|nr:CHAD domain-containing protein [Pirellulaceae bacterium]